MNDRDVLRHDAASLFRFIQRITDSCQIDNGPQTYDSPSIEFFKYVDELAGKTLEYLDRFADAIPADPALYHFYRQKLWDLRSAWSVLHQFIKPAFDADTLQVPLPLIQWLTRRLNAIPSFENARFVVFHTSEVNYLHLNTGRFRGLAQQLSSLVPGGQTFPTDLGLIGIPYSQASTLFLNCLIPHEMGHYVYQQIDAFKKLLPHFGACLKTVLLPKVATITASGVQWCVDRVQSCSQEMFCDLFAASMIGPAYTYAYIEIFDLPRVLNPDGKALQLESEFNVSHPSHVFRLQQQILLLRRLGWWPHVQKGTSHYAEVLQVIESVPATGFSFVDVEQKSLAPDGLNVFLLLCPHIHDIITATLSGLNPGVDDFERDANDIRQYLSEAIVPSTVLREGVMYYPDPVAIINAAYQLHLDNLDGLIGNIEHQDTSSVRTRGQWADRLELWITKAIEDNSLLVKQTAT